MMNPTQNIRSTHHRLTTQHWSYSSEQFAGGDNLLTAIERGWTIDQRVVLKRHWFAGMRCIEIFTFTIRRHTVTAEMAVIGNPYVQRFLATHPHELVDEDTALA